MGGGDHDKVCVLEHLLGERRDALADLTLIFILLNPWIEVGDDCALLLQLLDDAQRRALAVVVDVLFVSNTQHQHLRAVHRLFGAAVQELCGAVDAVFRHLVVNHHRAFDHRGVEAVLSGFPGEVVRVQRDAVSAQTRSRIERLEAVGLGLSRVHNLPHADAHFVAEHGQLVDQTDVDVAVGVFENLLHLGDRRAGYLIDLAVQHRAVHGGDDLGGVLADGADNLRGVLGLIDQVAWIDALRREAKVEVLAAL